MDGYVQPAREGTASGDSVLDADGFIEKRELKVGQARSLAPLLDDFAFFTPAVLYLHGRFRDAPLADFVYMVAPDCKFYYRKFHRPMFRGLDAPSNGNPDWNFVLWAVRKDHWEDFANWMVSLTLTYEDERAVAGIGEQRFDVIDPLAADRSSVWHKGLPSIPVTAFGINGSKFRAGFVLGENMLMDPPRLRFFEPGEDMKVFTEALYGGGNPVDARAYHKWKESRREEGTREDQT